MENVSFIVPAYNCENTVGATVASIFDGNYEAGDEVIIVNDRSTDGTEKVIGDLKSTYSEIKLINHERNRGGGAARNSAVAASRSKLIFCLDSDNLLVPESVSKLRIKQRSNGADALAFAELHFFEKDPSRPDHKWIFKPGLHGLGDALAGPRTPIASGNYLFTKASWEAAGRYPESAKALDAWGFGLRQLATGARFEIVAESHYLHRYGHESYWMRESTQRNTIAFEIVTPFLAQIEPEDANYIKEHATSWFDSLTTRPIRVHGGARPSTGILVPAPISRRIQRRCKMLLYRILGKIKT